MTDNTKRVFSFRTLVSKIGSYFNISSAWKYHCRGGHNYSYNKFNWLALIHYKKVTEWYGDTYRHSWRETKSIFSRKWIKYEHEYFVYCSHGTWNRPMTEEAFEIAVDRASNGEEI